MAEHPNVQRIRNAYAAFSVGDLTAALKDLAPNAVFHFNGRGPLSGDHTGVDDISAALIGTFELTAGTQKLDIASVYADDHPFEECLNNPTHDWETLHSWQPVKQLVTDITNDTLPSVVFVDGTEDVDDEHPTADIQVGEAWTKKIYDALVAGRIPDELP